MEGNDSELRVLILAPLGGDAKTVGALLARRGIKTQICRDPAACASSIQFGASALLLTEEALELEGARQLLEALKSQPEWSELPVIILTTGGELRKAKLLDSVARAAGTITLLERPIGTTTLLRSLEVALNSRRRQFQVRDLLIEQQRSAEQLGKAHARLADRAHQLDELVQSRTAKLAESNQRLRREIKEREKAEKARERLRRKLANAQEEERRRIARELHDQMGQNLTTLNLGLRSLANADPSRNELEPLVRPLRELAAQTARDLHRIALELRPSVLDDLGLVKALGNLLDTWQRHSRIETDFESANYNCAGVSSEIETALYRVVQEALNNVAKHSGANHVTVLLSRIAEYVQATIEDDGRGFDAEKALQPAANGGRLGLIGMKERLSGIGGELQIESNTGEGASLIVRIPLVRQR
jgi:signal transduction histidine kinase